jgi:hypothetical protein
MKRVQHHAVAEKEGDYLDFISLGKIDTKLGRGIEDDLLDGRIDPAVPIENSGDSSNANLSRGCNFSKPYLVFLATA